MRRGARADGAVAVGAVGIGSVAVGAFAVGALAIGALAIGRLAIGRATIKRLAIGDLEVGRLRVRELVVDDPDPTTPENPSKAETAGRDRSRRTAKTRSAGRDRSRFEQPQSRDLLGVTVARSAGRRGPVDHAGSFIAGGRNAKTQPAPSDAESTPEQPKIMLRPPATGSPLQGTRRPTRVRRTNDIRVSRRACGADNCRTAPRRSRPSNVETPAPADHEPGQQETTSEQARTP